MDEHRVQEWLDGYVRAWASNDPADIGALFSEDATYHASPYDQPLQGREEIVRAWLDEPDQPDTWRAHYEPIHVSGDTAVAHGRSTYLATEDEPEREWANVFFLRFDEDGRCREYREWYQKRPKSPPA